MPRCKRYACVEQMKTFELSKTAVMPMSEHPSSTAAEEDGLKEINTVQVRRRRMKRGGTEMMSREQPEKH